MLEKDFILNNKIEKNDRSKLPQRGDKTGYIYFLIKNNEVIYVGQSRNINQRMSQHNLDSDYTHYYITENRNEDIRKLESQYIKKFSPKDNTRGLGLPTTIFPCKVNDNIYYKIKEKAVRENISISSIVNKALLDYLNNYI